MNLGQVVPDGDDWIPRKLRDLEREITELRSARTLQSLSTSAVAPRAINSQVLNYDLTTSETVLVPYTLSFPNGFRACLVNASVTVGGWNGSASAGILAARAGVHGFGYGTPGLDMAQPNNYASAVMTLALLVVAKSDYLPDFPTAEVVLDGEGYFQVDARGYTGNATWTHISSPTNVATLRGTALFLR